MYYYGGYSGGYNQGSCGCSGASYYPAYGYGYGTGSNGFGYNAAIILVLFILLVIIIGSRVAV